VKDASGKSAEEMLQGLLRQLESFSPRPPAVFVRFLSYGCRGKVVQVPSRDGKEHLLVVHVSDERLFRTAMSESGLRLEPREGERFEVLPALRHE
jgi:hypothetical protein